MLGFTDERPTGAVGYTARAGPAATRPPLYVRALPAGRLPRRHQTLEFETEPLRYDFSIGVKYDTGTGDVVRCVGPLARASQHHRSQRFAELFSF